MRSKQTGVTLIGWLILLTPMALCGYAGVRLTPVYLNFMKVAKTLNSVKAEVKATDSQEQVRRAIDNHLNIEGIDFPGIKDFKITREGRSWVVSAAYDDQAPLFANVFILVTFDKSVTLGSESGE